MFISIQIIFLTIQSVMLWSFQNQDIDKSIMPFHGISFNISTRFNIQFAGAVEYTDYFSVEG